MPRSDKSKYTDKQERKADHIAEGYEKRCVPEKEAERRAWATVNKDDGATRSREAPDAGVVPGILRPIKEAGLAAKLQHRGRLRPAQHPPRRQRRRASAAGIRRNANT